MVAGDIQAVDHSDAAPARSHDDDEAPAVLGIAAPVPLASQPLGTAHGRVPSARDRGGHGGHGSEGDLDRRDGIYGDASSCAPAVR